MKRSHTKNEVSRSKVIKVKAQTGKTQTDRQTCATGCITFFTTPTFISKHDVDYMVCGLLLAQAQLVQQCSSIGRVRTPGHVPKKTRWVFLGKPTLKTRLKNPGKNPAQNKQILMSYSTVIKKFFTRLKDVNIQGISFQSF